MFGEPSPDDPVVLELRINALRTDMASAVPMPQRIAESLAAVSVGEEVTHLGVEAKAWSHLFVELP